ncbi:MAG: hypothetical protein J6Y94_02985 [Bacteriovoracaceae bacterium]|nr:hypothetical protein [Bacteriovoracaceae bacterium]
MRASPLKLAVPDAPHKKSRSSRSAEQGQAIFELLIFIPFLLLFMQLFMTISSSINGAINQQKAVRGYFYQVARNNSRIPTASDLTRLAAFNLNYIGMSVTGWMDRLDGDIPVASCFHLKNLGTHSGALDQNCDDASSVAASQRSNFIRLHTAYGVCSALFDISQGQIKEADGPGYWSAGNCSLR